MPFIYFNGERYLATVSDKQFEHLYPIKTLLSHGIELAGSSDCPVVPTNPFAGMIAAFSRMSSNGRLVGGTEKISVLEARQMYTRNAAFCSISRVC
jgi:predicted amidohydrolase YtcJ